MGGSVGAGRGWLSRFQVLEGRDDPTVVAVGRRETQLPEDAGHVLSTTPGEMNSAPAMATMPGRIVKLRSFTARVEP